MILFDEPNITPVHQCPYLFEDRARLACFAASELSETEIGMLLSSGWRKFGYQYFRPLCIGCRECVPIRVLVRDFRPSKSQRKVIKKNALTEVKFGPLQYSERVFEIYREHSGFRFGEKSDRDHFRRSLCASSCPSGMSSYYVDGDLQGVGFLDRSHNGLSSVYFIYTEEVKQLSLGTYSVIREIEYARELGLDYYYLGYVVEGCGRMAYKGRFFPHERYDWLKQKWERVGGDF
ncbi:MAG: arginyltransferase [Chitinispirillaceae bacterium]